MATDGITGTLREMGIGQTARWPLEKLTSVRSTCSTCGLMWGRFYSTSIDTETRTITVTRKA